jgi:multicomponent Na+:H+ antiporter subunit A
MIALLVWPALVGTAVTLFGARLNRIRPGLAAVVCASAPAATLVWLLTQLGPVNRGEVQTATVSWMPRLGVDVDLRLDSLAAVMILLAAGVGVAVFV